MLTHVNHPRRPLLRRVVATVRRDIRALEVEARFRYSAHGIPPERNAGRGERVIVVGGGLSGLASAFLLQRAGFNVTVLEASGEFGGRASTSWNTFEPGLIADHGGFRFSKEHFRVRDYLSHFEMNYSSFYPDSGNMFVYLGGDFFIRHAGERIQPSWISRPLTIEELWTFDQECEVRMSKIEGGAGGLPKALVDSLSGRVQLRTIVKRIQRRDDDVIVEVSHDGKDVSLTADRVVVAIPLKPLRRIKFLPELGAERGRVMSQIAYRPGALAYFEIPTTYWQELGLTGFGVTDTVGEVWTPYYDPHEKYCITIAYLKDEKAEEILALAPEKRDGVLIERLEKILPEFGSFVKQSTTFSWDETPFIGGIRSTARFMSDAELDILRAPEGRIHFAGEHLGGSHIGWMEGALESAERVEAEALAALTNQVAVPAAG